MFTYKHRLPWITNSLGKLINKKNKLHEKRNDIKYSNAYKKIKTHTKRTARGILELH